VKALSSTTNPLTMSKTNEGTSEKEFVLIEKILTQSSWAEETDEVNERDEKPRQAWAVQSYDDAPSIASIQAEEAKKASEAAAKKGPYRPPQPKPAPSYDYERSYDPPPRSERPPRERHPVPTEPPFTAFVGNLSYDITEQHLEEFFSELGVVNVRLMRDPGNKPKGFGYVEFSSAKGLSMALEADDTEFVNNRKLNVDVAKPPAKLNTSWGPGNREGGNRPFGQRDRDDRSSWGPGSRDTNRPSSSSFRTGTTSNYKPPSVERPKLNINPPAQKPEPRELAKPKGSAENPFGTAITDTVITKMNNLAKERLEKEMERDAKRKAEEEKRRDSERPRQTLRGSDSGPSQPQPQSQSSWRSNNNAPKTTSSFSPREPNRGSDRKPGRTPVQIDSEGFREQGHGRPKEHRELPTGSAARASQNEALSKQNHKKTEQPTQISKGADKPQNRYAGLEEEEI